VFALLLLGSVKVGGQVHPLARDVVVSFPPQSHKVRWEDPGSNPAPHSVSPTGKGLLRFYGCVTCHDLAVPPFRGRWGPDLDTVGSKTPGHVLDQLLRNPASVRPDARMPMVPTSGGTRGRILKMLRALRGDLGEPVNTAHLNGEDLYKRGDCRQCHRRNGKGGDRGPSLDGVAQRVATDWLAAYLMNPSAMVANSRMPLFEWEEAEAWTLAVYLAGEVPTTLPDQALTDREINSGVSAAAQVGCFQCHRVKRFSRYLELPDAEGATAFVSHHQADASSIRIDIPSAQLDVMTADLNDQSADAVSQADFLEAFWQTPIPMQGSAPAAYDTLASKTHPADCAACHTKQHEEWKQSLHAAAMGPGVIGQLADGEYNSAGFVEGCQSCHAPNGEQHAALPTDSGHEVNYQFDTALRGEGVTCLACHVRAHVRSGPPVADRPPAKVWRGSGHGGAHEATVFERSEFCSHCHQFGGNDRQMNGTLLQNTYVEWEQSPHARNGQTCQSCHMPDRSHTWLGIHDSATVASAIEVTVSGVDIGNDVVSAMIEIRNAGAGHHLPTYVTPKILVTVMGVDGEDLPIGRSRDRRAIGREIILNAEESGEVYDTRIPAGGTWAWTYRTKNASRVSGLAVRLEVYPDHFYNRFFKGYDRSSLSATSSSAIATASENASTSNYIVFEETFPLQVPPRR
jgi:mono/diheme cytochrome c family protein